MTDASPGDRPRSTRLSGETGQTGSGPMTAPDPEAARVQIRERARTVRESEFETALRRLEATDDLRASDRAVIEALADRLVARLIAVPDRRLRVAADADPSGDENEGDEVSPETVETALDLFG